MAKQTGILPIQGTIGNLTFFKSRDGYMVKTKSAVAANRIATDAAFQRTRENNAEFKSACKAGKQLRLAFRSAISKVKDGRMVSRLTTSMLKVIQADATSERGLRNVIDGEATLLEGFEFNSGATLSATLFTPFTVAFDRTKGEVRIAVTDGIPLDMIVAPEGVTHFKLFAGAASIDFENEIINAVAGQSDALPYNNASTGTIDLPLSLPANSTHPVFIILGIEFMQQVNGKFYSLKNGAFNACSVVKADSPV